MIFKGKNIDFRAVEITDAAFIYSLRMDREKTKYISQVDGTVEDQQRWIEKYKIKEQNREEYYFVICDKQQNNLGLVRLYDFIEDSFCWGSWIILDTAPKLTAIESALMVYEFAYYNLKFNKTHFDVKHQNVKVVEFHKRLGAIVVREDEINKYFECSKEIYEKEIRNKYLRYLK